MRLKMESVIFDNNFILDNAYASHAADGVSLTMYLIMLTGVILWEIYGLLIYSLPIILANFITASLLIMIVYFKIKHK